MNCLCCGKIITPRIYRGGSTKKFCNINCRVKYHRLNNLEICNQYTKKYHSSEEWKIKLNASSKLRAAVKSGKIKKPKICLKCKQESKIIHGHHFDYSQPLEVIWLCPKCHVNLQKEKK
jgi:hypothetical protein